LILHVLRPTQHSRCAPRPLPGLRCSALALIPPAAARIWGVLKASLAGGALGTLAAAAPCQRRPCWCVKRKNGRNLFFWAGHPWPALVK